MLQTDLLSAGEAHKILRHEHIRRFFSCAKIGPNHHDSAKQVAGCVRDLCACLMRGISGAANCMASTKPGPPLASVGGPGDGLFAGERLSGADQEPS